MKLGELRLEVAAGQAAQRGCDPHGVVVAAAAVETDDEGGGADALGGELGVRAVLLQGNGRRKRF